MEFKHFIHLKHLESDVGTHEKVDTVRKKVQKVLTEIIGVRCILELSSLSPSLGVCLTR